MHPNASPDHAKAVNALKAANAAKTAKTAVAPDARFTRPPRGAARVAAAAIALWACGGAAAQSAATAPADAWRFSLTPYVWLPTINAHINYPIPAPGGGGGGGGGAGGGAGGGVGSGGLLDGLIETEIGPNKYLANLNFALMLAGEARRGPWSMMFDYIGMRASGEGSTVGGLNVGGRLPDPIVSAGLDTGTRTALRADVLNLAGGYAVIETERYRLDAIAGVRWARFQADLDWSLAASVTLPDGTLGLQRAGSTSVSRDPIDAIVGVRGRWRLDEQWSVPYYLDVGTGSSQLTWQAFVGASRAFGWGEMLFAWRHLSLQDERREVFRRVTLSGPTIGATFRF
jgi:hypothetical protein